MMYGTGESSTSIIIVDANWALCRGYSAILKDVSLSSTIRVNTIDACIGEVLTWSETMLGLVILGPNLDECEMFRFLRWLHKEKPNIKSIVVSRRATDSVFCLDVAANHVSACLSVTARCEDIAQAVLAVIDGKALFSSEMFEMAFQPIRLSPRERDVLRLMAQGLTYDQIAKNLTLSTKTIDNHIQTIFKKLSVNDRQSAVTRAQRRALL